MTSDFYQATKGQNQCFLSLPSLKALTLSSKEMSFMGELKNQGFFYEDCSEYPRYCLDESPLPHQAGKKAQVKPSFLSPHFLKSENPQELGNQEESVPFFLSPISPSKDRE